jgi:hypothetical protein
MGQRLGVFPMACSFIRSLPLVTERSKSNAISIQTLYPTRFDPIFNDDCLFCRSDSLFNV